MNKSKKFFTPYFPTCVKLGHVDPHRFFYLGADPNSDRHKNGNSDPDRHHKTMPIHNTGYDLSLLVSGEEGGAGGDGEDGGEAQAARQAEAPHDQGPAGGGLGGAGSHGGQGG